MTPHMMPDFMRRTLQIAFFLLFLIPLPQTLNAQQSQERFVQERLIQNRKLRDLEKYLALEPKEEAILAKTKKLLLDYGGWVDVTYTEYHDDDNSRQEKDIFDADLSVDARAWVKATLRPRLGGEYIHEHSLYARFRNFYISRWPNEEQPAVQDDNDGPHVDLLYADLDLRFIRVRAGRQHLSLGQGIAYYNVHDAIQVVGSLYNWELSNFVAKTLPHEENIDYSIPGFDKKSERYFVGTQLAWTPIRKLRLYSYSLIQKDESDPRPITGVDYTYNSQHWGIGSSLSNVFGFSSWAEYILETGSSAIFATPERSAVLAQAANVGMNYVFPWLTHPDITLEYAYGSGDKDRTSVTNTEGGNLRGNDNNFLPFGIYPAGYALAPTLSNIQILRVGGSARPLEKFWQLEHFKIGVDGYFYWKDEVRGGIYDVDATLKGKDVGRELDVNLYWQVVSDVTASVRWGIFFPAGAYPRGTNDPEIYLSTTLTFSL